MPQKVFGECLFLDVGQGTANAVILRDGRILLIDAGPYKISVLHELLDSFEFESIDRIVLSHNDRDHIRGWEEITRRYGSKIGQYYLVQDRVLEEGDIFDYTMHMVDTGVIPRPMSAQIRNLARPECIWSFDGTQRLRLMLLYPDLMANIEGQKQEKPNQTSAITMLICNEDPILFPGDSTVRSWKTIASTQPRLFPMKLSILVVPHHGGFLDCEDEVRDLTWLFSEVLRTKTAVISVGTANPHGHPRTNMISALLASGANLMCTQVTTSCHGGLSVAGFKPGVMEDLHPFSLSRATSNPAHVGCAGTVVATLDDRGIEISKKAQHLSAILRKLSTPKCLNARPLDAADAAQLRLAH